MVDRLSVLRFELEQHALVLEALGHAKSLLGDMKRLTRCFAIVEESVIEGTAECDAGEVHHGFVFFYADHMVGPGF